MKQRESKKCSKDEVGFLGEVAGLIFDEFHDQADNVNEVYSILLINSNHQLIVINSN
jgi:hypothetical protein